MILNMTLPMMSLMKPYLLGDFRDRWAKILMIMLSEANKRIPIKASFHSACTPRK
jgi:hypothetical protein